MNGYIICFLALAVVGTAVWAHLPQWMTAWANSKADRAAQVRDALAPGDFQRWEDE